MRVKTFLNTHLDDLAKGALAVGTNVLAIITSAQEQIEWGLRVASLAGAVLVSAFTVWSIWRKNRTP